eukprot:scaffold6084_cov267-Pinguiococcus_pyrenoidosus.AAC.4
METRWKRPGNGRISFILADDVADDPSEGLAAWRALKRWYDGSIETRDDLACDDYENLQVKGDLSAFLTERVHARTATTVRSV